MNIQENEKVGLRAALSVVECNDAWHSEDVVAGIATLRRILNIGGVRLDSLKPDSHFEYKGKLHQRKGIYCVGIVDRGEVTEWDIFSLDADALVMPRPDADANVVTNKPSFPSGQYSGEPPFPFGRD
jgi:hypothetical protein